MPVKINYIKKNNSNLSANSVLFTNEKFSLNNLKKHISNNEYNYISDLQKNIDLKKYFCLRSKF